ncbi:uncharacterized protein LOC110113561 isoform X1 [Dendrobium catenatum]|uniref:Putative acetyltransferase NSI n=1 Tax=Dendrobium catenatum TaxID=906689 RepID=A0A2I0VP16_9ASPA|nr:uncharacterized protein LOC110113561 isoform X1 [Dendrobium catenatum]XP_020701857.1 uncharacterized protein LOC110113561 isoform X1 [Dendrobium catenatum]XP_020701858.1 uncharacterized protein LOC110113561 isoform X1 [Dendrobium catenatum]XP_028556444.1 uncharacterized protein LOC110113561 isoform X1 [Dendrobium catenatum]XP_028556445.1 uncharacterized protein LOC110113561 isoform X1 [Dendrobium catenatum]PKU65155.1 putative acetyltransferase NSI [Dendrobium catenatum]
MKTLSPPVLALAHPRPPWKQICDLHSLHSVSTFFLLRSTRSPSMAISSVLSVVSASHFPFSSPYHHLRRRAHPPISISTDPSHVDVLCLRDLLVSAGHSCHRFPVSAGEGLVEPADVGKLRTAIDHSFILVSVFCRARFLPSTATAVDDGSDETSVALGFENFFESNFWAPGPEHHLIGFGRAVSDIGLTASIHDVVVMPSLQKQGIGRKIVERIIRILTNKGIYDISALCSEKERFFFEACGFGKDPLDSTTMMYTRTPSTDQKDNFMVKTVGRMQLVVPHSLELYPSEKEHCGG